MTAEPGVVHEVVYVGMSTRFLVRLDHGEQLVAVRQNMDAPGQARSYQGRRVTLAWAPDHQYVLKRATQGETER
jgi:putative spermidine/putrescine transport system ATP-binding protein